MKNDSFYLINTIFWYHKPQQAITLDLYCHLSLRELSIGKAALSGWVIAFKSNFMYFFGLWFTRSFCQKNPTEPGFKPRSLWRQRLQGHQAKATKVTFCVCSSLKRRFKKIVPRRQLDDVIVWCHRRLVFLSFFGRRKIDVVHPFRPSKSCSIFTHNGLFLSKTVKIIISIIF